LRPKKVEASGASIEWGGRIFLTRSGHEKMFVNWIAVVSRSSMAASSQLPEAPAAGDQLPELFFCEKENKYDMRLCRACGQRHRGERERQRETDRDRERGGRRERRETERQTETERERQRQRERERETE
jgi:hypothetical protein